MHLLRLLAIALGAIAIVWQPSADWMERAYVNGGYPVWEHAAFAITNGLPWSLGDLAVLAGLGILVWRIVVFAKSRRPAQSCVVRNPPS